MRESLAADLLKAGELDEVERVVREDLVKNPRNARSLFVRWQALIKGGKNAEAAAAESVFREVWKNRRRAAASGGFLAGGTRICARVQRNSY